jgi:hypothetical protein
VSAFDAMQAALRAEVTSLRDAWWIGQCHDPLIPWHLFHSALTPDGGGRMAVGTQGPGPGYSRVVDCALHAGLTREQAWVRIWEAAQRLPLRLVTDAQREGNAPAPRGRRRER